jgi:nitrate reductase NapE component
MIKTEHKNLIKTARITCLWYLMIAITGVLGFMVFQAQIFVSGNPDKT